MVKNIQGGALNSDRAKPAPKALGPPKTHRFWGKPLQLNLKSLAPGSSRTHRPWGGVQAGTNNDWKYLSTQAPERQELLRKHPPLLHWNGEIQKIAKKGLNGSQYLDDLPDAEADLIGQPGESFIHWPQLSVWKNWPLFGSILRLADDQENS